MPLIANRGGKTCNTVGRWPHQAARALLPGINRRTDQNCFWHHKLPVDGMIQISVTDVESKRASDIANAYVEQLYVMNANLAITEAAQRRAFFDQQLDEERRSLVAAEDDLRNLQQRTGIIQLNGQAQMVIQTISQLRAEIASRERSVSFTASIDGL